MRQLSAWRRAAHLAWRAGELPCCRRLGRPPFQPQLGHSASRLPLGDLPCRLGRRRRQHRLIRRNLARRHLPQQRQLPLPPHPQRPQPRQPGPRLWPPCCAYWPAPNAYDDSGGDGGRDVRRCAGRGSSRCSGLPAQAPAGLPTGLPRSLRVPAMDDAWTFPGVSRTSTASACGVFRPARRPAGPAPQVCCGRITDPR